MEITSKIIKAGNSFAFRVPKALIDCKVLDKTKEYIIQVEPVDKGPIVLRTLLDHQNISCTA